MGESTEKQRVRHHKMQAKIHPEAEFTRNCVQRSDELCSRWRKKMQVSRSLEATRRILEVSYAKS